MISSENFAALLDPLLLDQNNNEHEASPLVCFYATLSKLSKAKNAKQIKDQNNNSQAWAFFLVFLAFTLHSWATWENREIQGKKMYD